MVTKNITKQPKSVVEVAITVPWTDISSKWDGAVQKLSADVELPGFRKGAAPLDMVEPKITSQVQQEVLKDVMPASLIEALQGSDIVPIDYPQYQVVSFAKGQPLQFNARVTERPKVSVGDYKGIKVSRPTGKQVTDEEVGKVIQDLFNRWKARQPASQSSVISPQSSDNSNNGVGGSLSFNTSANPAQASEQPATSNEPDDAFAKAVGADSLTDLKSKIKADLENEAKNESELDYEESILQEVEKMTTVDVPEVLVQDELNRMLVSLQRRVADMGLLLEDYLKGQNETLEGIKGKWREQAEKNVRMELGLSEIARAENVNITDTELQEEIDKIQDARIKSQFEAEEPKMHLRHALRQTKTLNLLKTVVGG
jgi:trigger factor